MTTTAFSMHLLNLPSGPLEIVQLLCPWEHCQAMWCAQCSCKAGAGGCCQHVAALLCRILDHVELGLQDIPQDKTCAEQPQQWHKPKKKMWMMVQALFSRILFVHHSYGKHKVEKSAIRMEKMKTYRACPSNSSTLTEEHIRQFCTSLEGKTNAPLFTVVMRNNDCKPLPQGKMEAATTTTSATSTAATTAVMNSASATSLTAEEIMWGKLKVTSEQNAQIGKNTRGQENSTI